MFQTDSDFVFDSMPVDSNNVDFKLKPNTVISIAVFTNNGESILEYSTGGGEGRRIRVDGNLTFVIDPDGYVDLPIVGKQFMSGMTIREAQEYLSQMYEARYNNTYVLVRTENRRIMVYNGSNSGGQVIPLTNAGISIIEAITLAGGISNTGDASKVRIIRYANGKQNVYEIDLSKIEGIRYANTTVESGDIIYVKPTPRLGREILDNIQPILAIISSTSIVYLAFTRVF